MPFQIVHNNIVDMSVDAIVNAANSMLKQGGGVCGAIFQAAGEEKLQKECDKLAPCPVGQAVITKAFSIHHAKYIIHAVGPIWRGGNEKEEFYLRNAYKNALQIASEKKCRSIAFPLISAGIYGYPKRQALNVATETFREFLKTTEMDIYLVVYDKKVVEISEELYKNVKHYIEDFGITSFERNQRTDYAEVFQYFEKNTLREFKEADDYAPLPSNISRKCEVREDFCEYGFENIVEKKKNKNIQRTLKNLLERKEETFSDMLFRLIDEKGYTDVEVYKRANMDRKLFSKIRSNREYCPKKQNVLALAISMRLSLDETLDLLNRAGYTLSISNKTEIIIRYFLEQKEYDIFLINETLFAFGENPL